jgi:hypothetical protein
MLIPKSTYAKFLAWTQYIELVRDQGFVDPKVTDFEAFVEKTVLCAKCYKWFFDAHPYFHGPGAPRFQTRK